MYLWLLFIVAFAVWLVSAAELESDLIAEINAHGMHWNAIKKVTFLEDVVRKGYVSVAQHLLETCIPDYNETRRAAHNNLFGIYLESPYKLATFCSLQKRKQLVRLFVQHAISIENECEEYPLISVYALLEKAAIDGDFEETVDLLDFHRFDELLQMVLLEPFRNESFFVNRLLDCGVNLGSFLSGKKENALMIAIRWGNPALADRIFPQIQNLNAKDSSKRTVLDLCYQFDWRRSSSRFMHLKSLIREAGGSFGDLQSVFHNGSVTDTRNYLAAGGWPSELFDDLTPSCIKFLFAGRHEELAMLIDRGADVDCYYEYDFRRSFHGLLEAVQYYAVARGIFPFKWFGSDEQRRQWAELKPLVRKIVERTQHLERTLSFLDYPEFTGLVTEELKRRERMRLDSDSDTDSCSSDATGSADSNNLTFWEFIYEFTNRLK